MKPQLFEQTSAEERDFIAAMLSVVPGLGQMYKHHFKFGMGILLLGLPCVLWSAVLLSLATLGASLVLIPALFWLVVALDAYELEDWHPDVRVK